MTTNRIPSRGDIWTSTIATLAAAYRCDRDQMATRVYALAEVVHQHYCLQKGLVSHSEARPDQQVAVAILMSLAGVDWWLVRGHEITDFDDTVAQIDPKAST